MRVDPASMAPLLDVAFAHDTKLLASALGPPPAAVVERSRAAGIPVAALAGAVEHAIAHKEAGADLIIAQGTEAGGHTGQIATMVLVPEVVDAVAPTPVLAAGGIGNGRQIAASLALGAEGVWCGSVWLTTDEAETAPAVKEKFLAAGSATPFAPAASPASRRGCCARSGPMPGRTPTTRIPSPCRCSRCWWVRPSAVC